MKNFPRLFLHSTFLMVTSFACLGQDAATKNMPATEINLVASTPGDEPMKRLLSIPANKTVDFIRWNVSLSGQSAIQQHFSISIQFGEGQPNTSGFKGGGEKKIIQGKYTISQPAKANSSSIYHLKSSQLAGEILLLKLSDNIFHFLAAEQKLMVGNGGWSYTLNRKTPLNSAAETLPVFIATPGWAKDTTQQIIFEGRTPCVDFARENNLTVAEGCFKLKWKLILYKDPATLQPTTYELRRTNSRETNITGRWVLRKGIPSNPDAIICQLDPDKAQQSISMLLADENVAFLLHRNNQLFTGNEDFSFTLNKKSPQ